MKKVSRCSVLVITILALALMPAHFGIGQSPGSGGNLEISSPQALRCLTVSLENLKSPLLDDHFASGHAITWLGFKTMIAVPSGETLYKGQLRIEGAIGSANIASDTSAVAACTRAFFYYIDQPPLPFTFAHTCIDDSATGARPLIGNARELAFLIHVGNELVASNPALDNFIDWLELETNAIHSVITRIGSDGKVGVEFVGLEQGRSQADQIRTWWIEAPILRDAFGDLEVTS